MRNQIRFVLLAILFVLACAGPGTAQELRGTYAVTLSPMM